MNDNKVNYYNLAIALAAVTVFYNLLEGLVSVFLGAKDDALTLLGFGVDSFAEVISGIGVWHMSVNLKRAGMSVTAAVSTMDDFEVRSLRITGFAYYLLAAGLSVSSAINLYKGHKPVTAFWGIVVSIVSIVSMWVLIHYKIKLGMEMGTKTGNVAGSQAIIADAHCSRTCLYLSVVLLTASLGYELTGYGGMDSIGGLAIAYLSLKEGRECFNKAGGSIGNTTGAGACSCAGLCKKEVSR